MLNLTDSAVHKMKELLQQVNMADQAIRIFMSAGGWRPSLAMGVANAAEDGDELLEKDGLKVYLDREANKMLENATIGFIEEQGFTIDGMMPSSCPTGTCPTSSSCQ